MDGDDRGTLIPGIPCPIKEYSSGSWWARYTPYLWVILAAALACLARPGRGRARRAAAVALAALMAADVLTFTPAVDRALDCTAEARLFVEALGEAPVEVALDDPSLGGFLYNLDDAGLECRYVADPDGEWEAGLGFVGLRARRVGVA